MLDYHTAMVLMRWQNIWCYTVQCTTRRGESWPNLHYQSDPRRLWSFVERIRVVTHPPTGKERERPLTKDTFGTSASFRKTCKEVD